MMAQVENPINNKAIKIKKSVLATFFFPRVRAIIAATGIPNKIIPSI